MSHRTEPLLRAPYIPCAEPKRDDDKPAMPLASNPEAYLKRAKEHAALFSPFARVVDLGNEQRGMGTIVSDADKNGAVGVRWDGSDAIELWNPLHLREVGKGLRAPWIPGDRVVDTSAAQKGIGTVCPIAASRGRVCVDFDGEAGSGYREWDISLLRRAALGDSKMSGGTPATQEEPAPVRDPRSRPVWALVIKDVEERAEIYGQQSGQGWRALADDMRARDAEGTKKYGTPLMTHNGRRPIVDCYQEVLDACVYMKQAIEEALARNNVQGRTTAAALQATYITLLETAKFLRGAVGYVDSPAALYVDSSDGRLRPGASAPSARLDVTNTSPTVDAWIESQETKHEAWRASRARDGLGDLHTRPADVDDEMTGQPVPRPHIGIPRAEKVAADALALAQHALDETAEQGAMLQELRTIVTETMGKNADALVEMTKKYLVAEERVTVAEQAADRLADLGKALQTKELEAQELSADLAKTNALMQHYAQEALDLRQSLKVAVTRENEALDKLQAANDRATAETAHANAWAKKFDEVVQAKSLVVTQLQESEARLDLLRVTKTSVVAECETLGRANVSLNDRLAKLEALLQRTVDGEGNDRYDTLEERVRTAIDESVTGSGSRATAKTHVSAVFADVRKELGL